MGDTKEFYHLLGWDKILNMKIFSVCVFTTNNAHLLYVKCLGLSIHGAKPCW